MSSLKRLRDPLAGMPNKNLRMIDITGIRGLTVNDFYTLSGLSNDSGLFVNRVEIQHDYTLFLPECEQSDQYEHSESDEDEWG